MATSPTLHHSLIPNSLIPPLAFARARSSIQEMLTNRFRALPLRRRFRAVNELACTLINETPSPTFLLPALLDFCDQVNATDALQETYTPNSFEFWLNHFSGLVEEKQREIRGKIVGKIVPRDEYQTVFPIGMNKKYQGTHFVAAHLSPDVDTTVASFWSWMDAFSIRVSVGSHQWFLPGGAPDAPLTSMMEQRLGRALFSLLPNVGKSLQLSAADLLTQKNLYKELGSTLITTIDHGSKEGEGKAILLVDEQGHYLGEWHSSDVGLVRQVVVLFKMILHWFEHFTHAEMIRLFAKEHLSTSDVPALHAKLFSSSIEQLPPTLDFTQEQQELLDQFFQIILEIPQGIKGTLSQVGDALIQRSLPLLKDFERKIDLLKQAPLFGSQGQLVADRSEVLLYLQGVVDDLDRVIKSIIAWMERLDLMIEIKHKVLKEAPHTVLLSSDLDEIRSKIGYRDFITILIPEEKGKNFPVGIIRAYDLKSTGLGTVSFRDFSNFDEIKMSHAIDLISVVDHHKSSVKTLSVPTALVGDVQSCNVLLAEQSFLINDRYSTGGLSAEEIDRLLSKATTTEPLGMRIYQRLLQKRLAARNRPPYFVDATREFNEYFFFLHAILDDTDLLTKVSARDIDCVVQLFNRLASLALRDEVEVISLDHLARDASFPKRGSQEIVQNSQFYEFYAHLYRIKEKIAEQNLIWCAEGNNSNIFLDTKEQNQCARVGQTKLFSVNFPSFLARRELIQMRWKKMAESFSEEHPAVDLHLHMVSTIASAEEMYQGKPATHRHQDELWVWIPSSPVALRHLANFLSRFYENGKNVLSPLHIRLPSEGILSDRSVFERALPELRREQIDTDASRTIAVIYVPPGSINSRKSMITPFIPK